MHRIPRQSGAPARGPHTPVQCRAVREEPDPPPFRDDPVGSYHTNINDSRSTNFCVGDFDFCFRKILRRHPKMEIFSFAKSIFAQLFLV